MSDAGAEIPDAERPPSTLVDAAWLDSVTLPEPLPGLPPHVLATVGELETHDLCERCHQAQSGSDAMRDEAGRAIGPDELWKASMMGMSGRDPYWLAVLGHELEEHPGATTAIEYVCTRCHAPAASVSRPPDDPIGFETITSDASPLGHLARDGVSCSLCHRIDDVNLGADASFTGGFVLETGQLIFGPHEDPNAAGMTTATGYQATYAPHVMRSALCATCHTVITHAIDADGAIVGPPFPEQVPYLEWRNSSFNDELATPGPEARSCAGCHLPTDSEDGTPILTQIANAPTDLAPRSPFGRHTFYGGNAYMLSVLSQNAGWTGAAVTGDMLMFSSDATEANLRTAATVSLEVTVSGGAIEATVHVTNETGHRFPTGYPSRRVFVRLTVEDATGVVLWRSGRTHSQGGLIDRAGDRLDYPGATMPHFALITREDQVQIYESVMGDMEGQPTRSLLRAAGYLKNNRILPRGWVTEHPDAAMTSPVGLEGDEDFRPGEDTVRYLFAIPDGATVVRAELVYQAVPAAAVEHLFDRPSAAIARFDVMRRANPDRGRVVAVEERLLP